MSARSAGARWMIGGAAGLLALAAAAGAEDFDPYKIPRAQFAARVHTIALKPLWLPVGTPQPERVRQTFEALLADGLRAKGYAVVPSSAYETLWRQMSERLGGTYDPVTGDARKEAHDAARDHTGRELARLHQIDAVLDAAIGIGRASFGRGLFSYYTWDEPLRWQGRSLGTYIDDVPQQVLGAYLNVVITDLAGVELYGIRAPIEWTAVYVGRGFEKKPPAEIYDEAERNQRAVALDLEPLIDAGEAE